MSDFLDTAIAVAREAGALLRTGFGSAMQVEHKAEATDLVTEYDYRSEQLILTRLRAAFPRHSFLAEESGPAARGRAYEWLIDPLDGTVNFAHGFPVFSVSLALCYQDALQVGVVYDPLRDELFAAEVGQGATLNGHPLRVSTETRLEKSLLATGFPYDIRTSSRNNFAEFVRLYQRAQAVRRAGSAALDCAWVAAGRLEGYWEFWIKPWDVGAGALIVREAGGRVSTLAGAADFLGRGSIVASNGQVHEALLAALNE